MTKGSGCDENPEDFDICLTDFGFAMKTPFKGTKYRPAGTRFYVAPELLEKEARYDYKVDIWSACVVAYVLLTG